jgi:hypothetical protein
MFAKDFADLASLQSEFTCGDKEEGLNFALIGVDLL